MNAKQTRFVAEYLIDLNATQAAVRAGYTAKNADVTGPRLLRNVAIRSAVAEGQAQLAEKHGITLDSHLDRLKVLAKGAETAEQYAAAITAEVSRGKVAGLYVDRSEVSVTNLTPAEREERVLRLLGTAKQRKTG